MGKADESLFMFEVSPDRGVHNGSNLSKREYFSAMAMMGMMTYSPPDQVRWSGVGSEEFPTVADWIASNSITMADALISALSVRERKDQKEPLQQ